MNNEEIKTPYWVLEAAAKVIQERLQYGFRPGTGADQRKLYAREFRDYYRWRCVKKNKNNRTWKEAYEMAAAELKDTFAEADPETMKKAYMKEPLAKRLTNSV